MGEWISVKDKLPQELENGHRRVLVWDAAWTTMYFACWDGAEWNPLYDREPPMEITHWQPLPLRIREVQPTRKVKWGRVVKWTLMGVGVSAILVVIVLI